MLENITLVGLILAVAGMFLKEIFAWLREKNLQNSESRMTAIETKLSSIQTTIEMISDQSSDMYEWHNKSDQDNVKIWYVRQSLENAVKDTGKAIAVMAKNSELQTRLLSELIESQRNIMKEQAEVTQILRVLQRNGD